MSRHLASALCASVSLLAATAAATPAFADAFASEAAPNRTINVPKDKSLSFRLDEPATKIVVSQPDIAEVIATTDRSFYVRGIETGATNLLVYGPGGRLMQVIDIRVGLDALALQSRHRHQALPGEHIKVQALGGGVLLTGDGLQPGRRAPRQGARRQVRARRRDLGHAGHAPGRAGGAGSPRAGGHPLDVAGPGLRRRDHQRQLGHLQLRQRPDRQHPGQRHAQPGHPRRHHHRRSDRGAGGKGHRAHVGAAEPGGDVGRGSQLPGRRRVSVPGAAAASTRSPSSSASTA